MIEISKLKLNNSNKDILNEYKLYLLIEEHLEEKTTCDSYLYDIYKYLLFLEDNKIKDCKWDPIKHNRNVDIENA